MFLFRFRGALDRRHDLCKQAVAHALRLGPIGIHRHITVGKYDDSDPVARIDRQVGAVPGKPSAVSDQRAVLVVDQKPQAEAELPALIDPVNGLHLRKRVGIQDLLVTVIEEPELPRCEAGQVAYRRPEATGCGETSNLPQWEYASLAFSQWAVPRGDSSSLFFAWVKIGTRHLKRFQDSRSDEVLVRHARNLGDDPALLGYGEIGVLPFRPGGVDAGDPGEPGVDFLERGILFVVGKVRSFRVAR